MKTKNIVTVSLTVFISVIIIILAAGVFLKNDKTGAKASQPGNSTNSANSTVFTMGDVAKHNTSGDCWTAINGEVFNVTGLIPAHSGGSEAIIANCGKDGSEAFNTKEGRGTHSERAKQVLNNYYVGALK